MAILTEDLKQKIRELRNAGKKYKEIEEELGVNSNNISRTINHEEMRKNNKDCSRRYRIKLKMTAKGQDFYSWQERLGEHR